MNKLSDINSVLKNNPSMFANKNDISKKCCCYVQDCKKGIVLPAQSPPSYTFGGKGGIPLIFNKSSGKVFVDQSDKHSVTIGQTGSKKSRLIAMPLVYILGASQESMIISDPKAEIFSQTSNFLFQSGYNVKVINLREPQTGAGWNPLMLPYQFYKQGDLDHSYEFANDIAVNLTAIDKSEKEVFWDNCAGSLFFGLILLLFKYCYENNLSDDYVNIESIIELRNLLFPSNREISKKLWEYARKDIFIESLLIGTVATAESTQQGILSVFDQKMRVFLIRPSLMDLLSTNQINFETIDTESTAIFLILPDEKTSYNNLVSLFVKQSYEYMIYKAQNINQNPTLCKKRINYILDEFSSLPAISDFPAMITAARSRNIRFNLFLQSKKQLSLKYGDDCDTIMSNCENWVYLSSRELDFLKELSELCGNTNGSGRTPLLSISDLQRLNKNTGQALILSGRNKPIISDLPDISFYKNDSVFFVNLYTKRTKRPFINDFYQKITRSFLSEHQFTIQEVSQ